MPAKRIDLTRTLAAIHQLMGDLIIEKEGLRRRLEYNGNVVEMYVRNNDDINLCREAIEGLERVQAQTQAEATK